MRSRDGNATHYQTKYGYWHVRSLVTMVSFATRTVKRGRSVMRFSARSAGATSLTTGFPRKRELHRAATPGRSRGSRNGG